MREQECRPRAHPDRDQVPLDRPHGGAQHILTVARELPALRHAVTLPGPGREPLIRGVHAALDAKARLAPLPRKTVERARATIDCEHSARRIAAVLDACA